MNFTQYNNLSSQVTIHNQFNRFLNDQAIKQVKSEKGGRIARKEQAREVANIVEGRLQETFQMLTGRTQYCCFKSRFTNISYCSGC